MNKVCHYIENIDFHIKRRVRNGSDFDHKVLFSANCSINSKEYKQIKQIVEQTFKEWEEKTKANKLSRLEQTFGSSMQGKFERDVECNLLKEKLEEVTSSEENLANCLVQLFYVDRSSFNKSTLWNLVGRQLYENVKSKHTSFNFPVKDENGALTFLYENYQCINISLEELMPKATEEEEKEEEKEQEKEEEQAQNQTEEEHECD